MKKIIGIFVLLQCFAMQGTWFVNQLVNQSDLQLDQGVRTSHTGNHVEIQSISNKINKAKKSEITYFDEQEAFGTVGGCTIVGHSPRGEKVSFSFITDPTHRVANGRARYVDMSSRIKAGSINKGMMARVLLEQGESKKVIGYYCGYQEDNQPFNLVLQGSHGAYKAILIPVSK